MKTSDYIINFIEKQGTNCIFSMSGGMITHLEDSIFLNNNLKLISLKHEQSSAFAAEGYARSTGKMGVAMGTSGPGATNMITGIASAFYDSIPVLYITGQVNTNEITQNLNIRQTGFQEADIVSISKKITKFSYQIKKSEEIRYILEKSFFLANHGRKGPILLDIPMNIQKEEINENDLISFFDSEEYNNFVKILNYDKNINYLEIINLFKKSTKPIILVGGGVKFIKNKNYIKDLSERFNIPIVSSLMGLDSINHDFKNYIGMIGSYGNREANISLMNSDLILVLGSRLDIRQTGADKNKFIENKTIIHVDIDKNELGYNIKKTQFKINQDLDVFLETLLDFINNNNISLDFYKWKTKTLKIKEIISKTINKKDNGFHNPSYILGILSKGIKKEKIIVNDVGQNQMISSTVFNLNSNDEMLNSGGLGSMGFSLPTSIGASISNKDKFIISVNGDGGFQMNIQELESIKYHNLPILIIILNNNSLGMVREFQDSYFEGRNIGTVIGYSCPNFKKIAKAYGIDYFKIGKGNFKGILKKCSGINKPTILEIEQNPKSSITKVMFGNTIDNQSPELDDKIKNKIKILLSK
ncbi:MAG: thiamine pyrophosphate-binding protein [Candidatus Gracilibacteria bacterium]